MPVRSSALAEPSLDVRMLDLLHSVTRSPNSPVPIRLNRAFRADLAWWHEFLHDWNGVTFLFPPTRLPKVKMTSDASGSWGCGAWHRQVWFQIQCDKYSPPLAIPEKELIPILLGCAAWGAHSAGHQVICHCYNQVVVSDLAWSSTQSSYQAGLKRFYDFCVRYNISTTFPATFLHSSHTRAWHPKPVSRICLQSAACRFLLGFQTPRIIHPCPF
jgi:hypothetical protein